MTLGEFINRYSSKRITEKEKEIAKETDIVIAVYTGHAFFLEGAIEHGIDLFEGDEHPEDMYPEEIDDYFQKKQKSFRGNIYYFDKIGFFNPFSQYK